MLKRLRLQLTLLYFGVALALLVLIAAGSYLVLSSYFESTTDNALREVLARETGGARANERSERERQREDDDEDEHHDNPVLAAVFVIPVSADGRPLATPAPLQPDSAAVTAAIRNGTDLRTIRLASGERVRLLTVRRDQPGGPAALQVGRFLGDQDRALAQLLMALVAFGATGATVLGIGSWWIAARAIRPAERAWEQQQTFVANASHELRTPLTLIRATAEVAQREATEPGQRDLLGDIVRESDHMRRLTDDLLLLSRLDSGRLPITIEPVRADGLISEVGRQLERVAADQGVQITLSDEPVTVAADPVRLRQILVILLDNALQHTPPGGAITVNARSNAPSNEGQGDITVSDSGTGIAPEHLPHVFDRFYRADPARGAESGSGLGLAIAKALVERQHGNIRLVSAPGKGTQAIVRLPLATSVPDTR